ncbi:hypothetical protein BBJ28_00000535 [Nothophytophthora sp. Chile5]|nr:hypothetical protein BBJ28_00000535 [Nothophytophthora sp. Chile5]
MHAVHVTLVKAVDLAAADFNGKSDPYVVFKVGSTTRKSSIIRANLNPEWDPEETFAFIAEDPKAAILEVQVFDHDRISKDDKIGSCAIPLAPFADKPETEVLMYELDVPASFKKQNRKSVLLLEIKVEKEEN